MNARERLSHPFDLSLNLIEGFRSPKPQQIKTISLFLGEPAIEYIRKMDARIFVESNFTCIPSSYYGVNEKFSKTKIEFVLRYKKRLLFFIGADEPSFSPTIDPYVREKSIRVDFLYESDFIKTHFSPNKDLAYGLVFKNQKKAGQDKSSYSFLRDMFNLVTLIDPSCKVILEPSDLQRYRIYKRVFAPYPNINIVEADRE